MLGHGVGSAQVQQKWDKEKAVTAEQLATAERQARDRERAAQIIVDKLKRDRDAKLKTAIAAYNVLAGELSDRPSRPASGTLPGDTRGGVACTGAQLYRQDALVLGRLASDADRLRIDLADCQTAYDQVRRALARE
jgi:hypothetical protein